MNKRYCFKAFIVCLPNLPGIHTNAAHFGDSHDAQPKSQIDVTHWNSPNQRCKSWFQPDVGGQDGAGFLCHVITMRRCSFKWSGAV